METSGQHPEEWEQDIRKKPNKTLITMWVIISLLTLMLLVVGGVGLYVWSSLQPTSSGEAIEVEIPKGMSANRVTDLLEQKGIIKNALVFKYYLMLKKEGSRFQAGIYELNPGMEKEALIAKLNAGDTVEAEVIRFTIPEGYTIIQIADKLSSEGIVNKEKFLALIDEKRTWGDNEAVRSVPDNDKLHKRLEGYLFPETYEMVKESTEEDIIKRMTSELDRKLSTLPEDWMDVLEQRGLTIHEMLTIASLVEREVIVDEERPMVASVIFNRIKKGMALQIDATVQYLLDKPKERLLHADLEVDSPYNTYKVNGLPPGPIASPSLDSIKAVLYPDETDYFYYVTKKDGTNTHLFAKTYNEHLKNIDKSTKTTK